MTTYMRITGREPKSKKELVQAIKTNPGSVLIHDQSIVNPMPCQSLDKFPVGTVFGNVCGPEYPKPHKWYARITVTTDEMGNRVYKVS